MITAKIGIQFDHKDHKEKFDEALGSYASEEERIVLAKAFALDALVEIIKEAIESGELESLIEIGEI